MLITCSARISYERGVESTHFTDHNGCSQGINDWAIFTKSQKKMESRTEASPDTSSGRFPNPLQFRSGGSV